jgi:hypothetical protein
MSIDHEYDKPRAAIVSGETEPIEIIGYGLSYFYSICGRKIYFLESFLTFCDGLGHQPQCHSENYQLPATETFSKISMKKIQERSGGCVYKDTIFSYHPRRRKRWNKNSIIRDDSLMYIYIQLL